MADNISFLLGSRPNGVEFRLSTRVSEEGVISGTFAVSTGPWTGKFIAAHFFKSDLVEFRNSLESLREELVGETGIGAVDGQLELTLEGNGLGQIFVTGSATDDPGNGSVLEFVMELDQSMLQSAILPLRQIDVSS